MSAHLAAHEASWSVETGMLLSSMRDGVLTLSLNRPGSRNALSMALGAELAIALDRAERDAAVRCVVLTGTGSCFSSGGDLKDMGDGGLGDGMSLDALTAFQRRNQRDTVGLLYRMAKPTLAVLPGPAAGAGLALALACDLRLMSDTALMTTAFTSVGFCGDYGASFLMTQIVGPAKTRELFFLADRVDAAEASRIGLVNWTCSPDVLSNRTFEIAHRLAARPTLALGYAKENINRAISSGDIMDCMDVEAALNLQLTQTQDHKTAVASFISKTTPVFHGR